MRKEFFEADGKTKVRIHVDRNTVVVRAGTEAEVAAAQPPKEAVKKVVKKAKKKASSKKKVSAKAKV